MIKSERNRGTYCGANVGRNGVMALEKYRGGAANRIVVGMTITTNSISKHFEFLKNDFRMALRMSSGTGQANIVVRGRIDPSPDGFR